MQDKNVRLLNNSAAITGVLLVLNAAIGSVNSTSTSNTTAMFNSARGLKPQIFNDLILGFHAAFVTTIYSDSAYSFAKKIIYIASTKKFKPFKNVTELQNIKTFLKDVIQVRIGVAITEVQTEIKTNGTVETTADDIEALVFPIPKQNFTAPKGITEVEFLTMTIKDILGNINGLQMTLKSINAALESTSSTGKIFHH